MRITSISIRFIGLIIVVAISFVGLQARSVTMAFPLEISYDTTPPTPSVHDTVLVSQSTTQSTTVNTQPEKEDDYNSQARFGIRVGGLISKQEYESTSLNENPESKIGLDLGILVSVPFGDGVFMLQPELHWMQKGYKIKDLNNDNEITTTLNYVELPLLARLNFGESFKAFVVAGPAIGWLIDGSNDPDNDVDPTDYLDDTEVSGYVGVGIGIGGFEIDLRYIAGLNDISSAEDFTNARNSSFGAGISLKF